MVKGVCTDASYMRLKRVYDELLRYSHEKKKKFVKVVVVECSILEVGAGIYVFI